MEDFAQNWLLDAITSYHIHHVQRYHYEMSISTPNSAIVPRLVENPIVFDATQNVTFLEL
jgi:hypothetical protein